ncbi:MAG TPA: hypothetical protein VED37_02320 [Ktedonobacteraceae bacterium]|nr:hypothetical protein [Ktedonobacteraceae bacterium]
MRIYGIDFTSAPSPRKPITCAICELQANRLSVQNCVKLVTFGDFEIFLRSNGPWMAALDFPFGQPFNLISNLGWPENWEDYVWMISSMGKQEFEATLKRYKDGRAIGKKLHLRITDELVGARSPMMLHRVPVGKMFFEGAPRLLEANVCVVPCRPVEDNRIVVEGYPALVARRFVGKQSYKSDDRGSQTREREMARREIVHGLRSAEVEKWYGLRIELSDEMNERMVDDPQGDELDAVLCSIQGGWAWQQKFNNYTFPGAYVRSEGWIADPATAK